MECFEVNFLKLDTVADDIATYCLRCESHRFTQEQPSRTLLSVLTQTVGEGTSSRTACFLCPHHSSSVDVMGLGLQEHEANSI